MEERDGAENEEAPLVGAVHEGTDEAADHHEHAHEERGRDVRERKAGREKNREKQEREGDEPLDVPYILSRKHVIRMRSATRGANMITYPDLARLAVSAELGRDGGST